MARTIDREIRENAVRMLRYIQDQTMRNRNNIAPISYRQMARSLRLSLQQVRFLCARLESESLIVAVPRYAEDGGQLANGYALTSRGRMLLRGSRRLEASC